MRHAYLIMAHNNAYTLRALLELIDDERNDIYLHVDSKAVDLDLNVLASIPKKSRLYLSERMNGSWAQMMAPKYLLMKSAYAVGYDYYHLLSGVDLPIKSQDYIHDFFKKYNGREFVGFKEDDLFNKDWIEKIYLFPNEFRTKNILKRFIRASFLKLQIIFHYKYRKERDGYVFKKGPEWFSITHSLMRLLVENEQVIKRFYKYSYLKDEQFVQTVLFNSDLRANIFAYDQEQLYACMRYVNWKEGTPECRAGSPSTITMDDVGEIVASDRIFARKFSDDAKDAVDYVVEYLSNEKLKTAGI